VNAGATQFAHWSVQSNPGNFLNPGMYRVTCTMTLSNPADAVVVYQPWVTDRHPAWRKSRAGRSPEALGGAARGVVLVVDLVRNRLTSTKESVEPTVGALGVVVR
jgi:hypothetical protein